MFEYVEDKQFISNMRHFCGKIMQQFCHNLKEDYNISARFYLVGSGAKNLILQNNSNPVDLDYNLEIVKCENIKNCRRIKDCARNSLNKALRDYNLNDCDDSTSVLTTKEMYFEGSNQTNFSIDICIVKSTSAGHIYRLIRKTCGNVLTNCYVWERASTNAKNIKKKVNTIKSRGKWMKVREEYKKIKNNYLIGNDSNHPSFICYIEAVNNVYNSLNNQ